MSSTAAATRAALGQMARQLRAVEWDHSKYDLYTLFRHHQQNDSHDYRMVALARFRHDGALPPGLEPTGAESDTFSRVTDAFAPRTSRDGQWVVESGGRKYADHLLLDFRRRS